MIDDRINPLKPCCAITLKITTTNAPVGPPIWTLEPPKNEIKKPATTAVTRPLSGDAPEATAIAIASGRATIATVRPAITSALNRLNE